MLRGAAAEARVVAALHALGWSVLATNWRGGGGELDAVVERAGRLRFVEVKLRERDDPLADEAVTASKRTRLRRAARLWLTARGEPEREVCFMVAMVDHQGVIEWIDDAFDG